MNSQQVANLVQIATGIALLIGLLLVLYELNQAKSLTLAELTSQGYSEVMDDNRTIMGERRDHAACLVHLGEIQIGEHHARLLARIGKHLPPWRDNQRMAIGLATIFMITALRRRDDEAARFDGARLQQNVPVCLPGAPGKGGGDRNHPGAGAMR